MAIEQVLVLRLPGKSPAVSFGDGMPPEVQRAVAEAFDERGPGVLDRSVRDLSHLVDPYGY